MTVSWKAVGRSRNLHGKKKSEILISAWALSFSHATFSKCYFLYTICHAISIQITLHFCGALGRHVLPHVETAC